MITSEAPTQSRPRFAPHILSSRIAPWLLAPLALVVNGYHPFSGDAGIYAAGIRHILNPSLYPLNAVLVEAFTRLSIFAWTVAALVRITHASLSWILLPLHLFSLGLFLIACRSLAEQIFSGESAHWCAVVLGAACCALPVAGTALVLMDPYVTARSFCTPASLFAVTACLSRRWIRTGLLLALAVLIHPLMGCYATAFVLILAMIRTDRIRFAIALCAAAFVIAGMIFAFSYRLPVSVAYREAVSLPERSFLFLARWHWYEILGLFLPLALYGLALRKLPHRGQIGALSLASTLLSGTSILIAALFVPPAGPYVLVPFQVMRCFHLIYAVGVVLCGGVLASLFSRTRIAAAAVAVLLFAGMAFAETITWPDCARIEWPGASAANGYQEAFAWIRESTPRDAVFAFDPQFVYRPGEDEQGFRAIAERDHLADDKDAGIVAVVPHLADRWAAQRNAEAGIDSMTDDERRTALVPLGATWILLSPSAATALPCPWRNRAVQLCRLSRR